MSTKIEWADVTWSPVTGCTPVSEGCRNCYAKRMARRLAGRFGYPEAPNHFDVTLHPDRLDQPLKWKKPRRIFVCSMSDLFHPDVPFDYINKVFNVMAGCWDREKGHTFIVLTKRPERIRPFLAQWLLYEMFGPLPNLWLGVTAENQEQADKRIPILLQTPAAVRFVSVEPLLGAVNLTFRYYAGYSGGASVIHNMDALRGYGGWGDYDRSKYKLNWVIVGAETGPGARPMKLEWARDLRGQCKAAGVPFFMKAVSDGAIPDDLMIREFPQ